MAAPTSPTQTAGSFLAMLESVLSTNLLVKEEDTAGSRSNMLMVTAWQQVTKPPLMDDDGRRGLDHTQL